jgi:hypothetical protein
MTPVANFTIDRRTRVGRLLTRPAAPQDAHELAPRLRSADVDALVATGAGPPFKVLWEAIEKSEWAATATLDDEVIACFGVRRFSVIGLMAAPWLLCTPAVMFFPKELLRAARGIVSEMLWESPILVQVVDIRDVSALRFLRALGFTEGKAVKMPTGFYCVPVRKEVPLV